MIACAGDLARASPYLAPMTDTLDAEAPPLPDNPRDPTQDGPAIRLYLVDGSGFIFRAFHALPPLTRKSDGLPVGAVAPCPPHAELQPGWKTAA